MLNVAFLYFTVVAPTGALLLYQRNLKGAGERSCDMTVIAAFLHFYSTCQNGLELSKICDY
jgi:hypothetical protein